MKAPRFIIGLVAIQLLFACSGCEPGLHRKSPLRNFAAEIEAQLAVGDSRKKVTSLLGEPLLDGGHHGVEVYRHSGSDLNVFLLLPVPGEKVVVGTLVTYNETGSVRDVASGNLTQGYPFWISAGDHKFFFNDSHEPEILIGPATSWNELEATRVLGDNCSLILVMSECPMERISLDGAPIADMFPIGSTCGRMSTADPRYRSFLQFTIRSGHHKLQVHQEDHPETRSRTKARDFKSAFRCISGETVFAELKAIPVYDGSTSELRGAIAISKTPSQEMREIPEPSPILWHSGTWYLPLREPL